jgi:hypothetical protein
VETLTKDYSTENAEFFANLSRDSYLDVKEFSAIYSDEWDIKFFNVGSTQCYGLWDDKSLIYVFRGTQPTQLSDIEADIKFRKIESQEGVGKVHRGFKEALDLIWDDLISHHNTHITVRNVITRNSVRNIYLAGHSLGAALATLAGGRFGSADYEGYTYGSPRVGNANYRAAFLPKFYRHRNNNDIVTRHPIRLIGFRHIGELKYFAESGRMVDSSKATWGYMFIQWIKGMSKGITQWEIDSFSDHLMDNYCELCSNRNKT